MGGSVLVPTADSVHSTCSEVQLSRATIMSLNLLDLYYSRPINRLKTSLMSA